jgi:hypothetical protein
MEPSHIIIAAALNEYGEHLGNTRAQDPKLCNLTKNISHQLSLLSFFMAVESIEKDFSADIAKIVADCDALVLYPDYQVTAERIQRTLIVYQQAWANRKTPEQGRQENLEKIKAFNAAMKARSKDS